MRFCIILATVLYFGSCQSDEASVPSEVQPKQGENVEGAVDIDPQILWFCNNDDYNEDFDVNNMVLGTILCKDEILHIAEVKESASGSSTSTETIKFPQDSPYTPSKNSEISAIRFFNILGADSSAQISIPKGGIRSSNAQITLKSRKGKGLHYLVFIYGKP